MTIASFVPGKEVSVQGIPADVLRSALKIHIRRGHVQEAVNAAIGLDLFMLATKQAPEKVHQIRLGTMAQLIYSAIEDVNVANPAVVLEILRLQQKWRKAPKKYAETPAESYKQQQTLLLRMVVLLAKAKKSCLVREAEAVHTTKIGRDCVSRYDDVTLAEIGTHSDTDVGKEINIEATALANVAAAQTVADVYWLSFLLDDVDNGSEKLWDVLCNKADEVDSVQLGPLTARLKKFGTKNPQRELTFAICAYVLRLHRSEDAWELPVVDDDEVAVTQYKVVYDTPPTNFPDFVYDETTTAGKHLAFSREWVHLENEIESDPALHAVYLMSERRRVKNSRKRKRERDDLRERLLSAKKRKKKKNKDKDKAKPAELDIFPIPRVQLAPNVFLAVHAPSHARVHVFGPLNAAQAAAMESVDQFKALLLGLKMAEVARLRAIPMAAEPKSSRTWFVYVPDRRHPTLGKDVILPMTGQYYSPAEDETARVGPFQWSTVTVPSFLAVLFQFCVGVPSGLMLAEIVVDRTTGATYSIEPYSMLYRGGKSPGTKLIPRPLQGADKGGYLSLLGNYGHFLWSVLHAWKQVCSAQKDEAADAKIKKLAAYAESRLEELIDGQFVKEPRHH